MRTTLFWKPSCLALGMLGCLLFAGTGLAADKVAEKTPATNKKKDRPQIEVVFCLDTTGSMSGMINGAKEKIWSIASTMAMAKPAPNIKMGLVGYRDRGDKYVTVITPLTTDLDKVYNDLMAYKAEGGGDTPESVNQALHEAVHKIQWSKEKKVYRAIFLVGDCPPHMDYQDDVKYPKTCKQANEKRIIINTIQCGSDTTTTTIWQEIARKAEGQYFHVAQSGDALAIRTPFDAEIAKINKKLDAGRVYYGAKSVQAEQKLRMKMSATLDKEASVSAKARRALYNQSKSGKANFFGRNELLHDLEENKVQLGTIAKDELPENLKKMTAAERKAWVKEKVAERKKLQKQLAELAKKRQAHIAAQLKKMGKEKQASAFSEKFHHTFKEQSKKYDFSVPTDGAAH